jgi:hypothetical protein
LQEEVKVAEEKIAAEETEKAKVEEEKKVADAVKAKQEEEQDAEAEADTKAAEEQQSKATDETAKAENSVPTDNKVTQPQENSKPVEVTTNQTTDVVKVELDKKTTDETTKDTVPQDQATQSVPTNEPKEGIKLIDKEDFDKMTPEEKQALEDKYPEPPQKTELAMQEEAKAEGDKQNILGVGNILNSEYEAIALGHAEKNHEFQQSLDANEKANTDYLTNKIKQAEIGVENSLKESYAEIEGLGHHSMGGGSKPGAGGDGNSNQKPSITVTFTCETLQHDDPGYCGSEITGDIASHID